MDAASFLLIIIAAGVNFGWQPANGEQDGLEYIVQVEPELLDALRDGAAVPIESNVPPAIGPIRKVKLVFGRGDLPRTGAATVQRTAHFADAGGWTPDRNGQAAAPPAATTVPMAGSAYDRYGPPASAPPSAVGPPPSVLERAQSAVTETGTTLRDGVEAGIRAANEELSRSSDQVLDATRNAGQQFGRQLQDWANDPAGQLQATGDDLRSATERTLGSLGVPRQQGTGAMSASTVAPPPWPVSSATNAVGPSSTSPAANASADAGPRPSTPSVAGSMAPRQTANGWSSISAGVAPPPLLTPQLDTTTGEERSLLPQSGSVAQGPSFPALPPTAATTTNDADDWVTGWGTEAASEATISRSGNAPATEYSGGNSDLVSVQPIPRAQNAPQQAAGPAALDIYDAPAIHSDAPHWQLGSGNAALPVELERRNGAPPAAANNHLDTATTSAAAPPASNALPVESDQPAATSPTEQPPWLPLLVVSLSLMGSLSANLFLGWSYMDARQKYRTLVRNTADKFRRAAS